MSVIVHLIEKWPGRIGQGRTLCGNTVVGGDDFIMAYVEDAERSFVTVEIYDKVDGALKWCPLCVQAKQLLDATAKPTMNEQAVDKLISVKLASISTEICRLRAELAAVKARDEAHLSSHR